MNVKEYIATGAVESYVLGLATEGERQEFEALCMQYPEIAQARERFERSLEQGLMQDAVPPPAALKARVLQAIETQVPSATDEKYEVSETPVRSMNPWKWIAAASIVLLVGAATWAIMLSSKYKESQAAIAEKEILQKELNETKAQLTELRADANTIQKPGLKLTSLSGVPGSPEPASQVTVFWDTTSKDVFLLVNNLPRPASGHQYQLWALLNGKPVDLGVFDIRQEKLVLKMKNVQQAQAFAITLEPEGGSEAPTMPNMYVYGKL